MTNFSHGFKCFHGRLPVPPHGWPLLTGSGIVSILHRKIMGAILLDTAGASERSRPDQCLPPASRAATPEKWSVVGFSFKLLPRGLGHYWNVAGYPEPDTYKFTPGKW